MRRRARSGVKLPGGEAASSAVATGESWKRLAGEPPRRAEGAWESCSPAAGKQTAGSARAPGRRTFRRVFGACSMRQMPGSFSRAAWARCSSSSGWRNRSSRRTPLHVPSSCWEISGGRPSRRRSRRRRTLPAPKRYVPAFASQRHPRRRLTSLFVLNFNKSDLMGRRPRSRPGGTKGPGRLLCLHELRPLDANCSIERGARSRERGACFACRPRNRISPNSKGVRTHDPERRPRYARVHDPDGVLLIPPRKPRPIVGHELKGRRLQDVECS